MSDILAARPNWKVRVMVWLLVAGGGLLLAAANWQLVGLAIGSQPPCVDHVRQGEGRAAPGQFSAAESACSPRSQTE